MDAARTPVIVGVGEIADRPASPVDALDPAGLMAHALRRAEADAGAPLAAALERLEIINEISWPYVDPVAQVTARIGRPGLAARYRPVGGQTPLLALHEAALAIRAGECAMAAVVGGEAGDSVRRVQGGPLPWPPRDLDHRPIRGGDHQGPLARALELTSPVNVYPLYETGCRAAWGQTLEQALAETATIWATNAAVAQRREAAWIRRPVSAAEIGSGANGNRLIAWPYRKLMVANPVVNQGAAVVVASLARARELGVAEERLVFVHGGSAADEPRDILARRDYAGSAAMEAVLRDALEMAPGGFEAVELYSCFPCVPKMARRVLGLEAQEELSVAGGLTFFGAPLNDYMSHAVVAMVERLRVAGGLGLLYGQGEYVTKHHALVLGRSPPPDGLPARYRRGDIECELATAAPAQAPGWRGAAKVETGTVLFDRDETVRHGVAILRTPEGARLVARVEPDDARTLAALMSDSGGIGQTGEVVGSGGLPVFSFV